MFNKEIWCVGTVRSGIDADSIGTKESAKVFLETKASRETGSNCINIGHLTEITRAQALAVIIEDILNFDKTGLRLGNTVRNLARMKLEQRLEIE